jgi:hypothetical protein
MTFDAKKLSDDQAAKLSTELQARGVKFLPGQAVRRLLDPAAGALNVLGSARRDKARKIANRAAAQKQAAAAAVPSPAKAVVAATAKK